MNNSRFYLDEDEAIVVKNDENIIEEKNENN